MIIIKNKNKQMQTIFEIIFNVILAIILPVHMYLLLVGGFIVLGTLLGILAARKENEKIDVNLKATKTAYFGNVYMKKKRKCC